MTQPFFMIFGNSILAARLSLIPFWIIFIFAMYDLGSKVGGSSSGFLVLAVALSSPHLFNISRDYFLDFPQISLTAATLWLLLSTDSFACRKYSFWFGVVAGLALLVKWASLYVLFLPIIIVAISVLIKSKVSIKKHFLFLLPFLTVPVCFIIVYYTGFKNLVYGSWSWLILYALLVLVPCIVSMYICFKKDGNAENPESIRLRNVACSFSGFSIIASPWLLWAAVALLVKVRSDMNVIRDFPASYDLYLNFFKTLFFTPVLWLVIIGGLISAFAGFRKYKSTVITVLSACIFFFIFALITTLYRDSRYILSFLILIPVFAGCLPFTDKIKNIFSGVIFSFFLLSAFIWLLMPVGSNIFIPIDRAGTFVDNRTSVKLYIPEKPENFVCQIDELISRIEKQRSEEKINRTIAIYQYRLNFDLTDQLIWQANYGRELGFNIISMPGFIRPENLFESGIITSMNPSPIVLFVYDKNDPDGYYNSKIQINTGRYALIEKISLGGGVMAEIYVPR
jgi:hypothetical protein